MEIAYHDGETHCKGRMSNVDGRLSIKGNVSQLRHDMWVKPSKDVLYTFTLCEEPSNRQVREASSAAFEAELHRMRLLSRLFKELDPESDDKEELYRIAESVTFLEFREDVEKLCERECATLRRQARLLQGLTFATDSERRDMLSRLECVGSCRACFPAHCVCSSE
mmetsp:Transcript_25954/g.68375  ORF Transcript_25954/g.68375 Transcript_25954/m.68375 type:complete len:166 (+) Transcript_25954:133-630(+)